MAFAPSVRSGCVSVSELDGEHQAVPERLVQQDGGASPFATMLLVVTFAAISLDSSKPLTQHWQTFLRSSFCAVGCRYGAQSGAWQEPSDAASSPQAQMLFGIW